MNREVSTQPFVQPGSIVRRIWGDADLVLLVFAGAAAEFALNRAVDWLFFTGAIPKDPLGRLFATAGYARQIAFASREGAEEAMAHINAAHAAVEQGRGGRIPDWAHRDVLYLLVDYSERAFRTLHRPLTPDEQRELWSVFRRVGEGLNIPDLPATYADWQTDRQRHLERDLAYTEHTALLYAAYRRHLGSWRYALLRQVQAALAPEHVRRLLSLPRREGFCRLLRAYPAAMKLGLRPLAQSALIPPEHLPSVRALDHPEIRP